MRPRSFDSEAASETALSDLLRRFDALQDLPAATTTGSLASVVFTGPIEATYLVAASDARDEIKQVADFVCDGVADHAEINEAWSAIQALNIGAGKVVLAGRLFNITDGVVVNPVQTEPGVMVGLGRGGTLISMVSGSDTSAVRVRAGATVRDFSILVNGTAVVTRGALEIDETDSAAFQISIDSDDGVGIWCDGPRSRVESCDVITRDDATHGIFVHADANGSKIINNYVIESRQHGIMIDGDAGGTGDHTQISGNTIRRPSQQTVDSFDGIHMEGPFLADHGPTIVGNIVFNDGGLDFRDGILVAAANVVDVTITGNTVGVGVGRWALNMQGVRSHASGNRLMGGIDVGGDDNHIVGNTVAIINDDSNGIVVGGDRNSIFDNKVFPQSGSDPAVGVEVLSGATDNVIGLNDLEQTVTKFTDAGTNTVELAAGASTPLTTKGDIHGFTTVDARLGVGTNGQVIFADSTVGLGIKWDDVGVWKTWTPTWTNLTVGNGTVVARYVQIGDTVIAFLSLVLGSTSSVDSSPVSASLPVTEATTYDDGGANVVGQAFFIDATSTNFGGKFALFDDKVVIQVHGADDTYQTIVNLNTTIPFTWTTSDIIRGQFTYEAA